MNFADISVKEPQSMVTAVIRLTKCAERRTGGHPEVESRRDETGEERPLCTVPGAVFRGEGYQFNSNWTETLSLPLVLRVGCSRLAVKVVEVIET
jgi:hypothetical protein